MIVWRLVRWWSMVGAWFLFETVDSTGTFCLSMFWLLLFWLFGYHLFSVWCLFISYNLEYCLIAAWHCLRPKTYPDYSRLLGTILKVTKDSGWWIMAILPHPIQFGRQEMWWGFANLFIPMFLFCLQLLSVFLVDHMYLPSYSKWSQWPTCSTQLERTTDVETLYNSQSNPFLYRYSWGTIVGDFNLQENSTWRTKTLVSDGFSCTYLLNK